MILHATRTIGIVFAACLFGACSDAAPDSAPAPSVAVSTVAPTQREFSQGIAALGWAVSDPRERRRLSLAHGGQVVAIRVTDGQSVHRGEAVLEIAADPGVRQAFEQARNALALARRQLAHTRQLEAQRLATQGQLDAARSAVADAAAALAAQRRLGGGAATATVTAPADGVILGIAVSRGERVAANATLATFIPTGHMIAQLGVDPDAAGRIRPGMGVTLHAVYASLPAARGRVRMVGRAIDAATHRVPVQVTLPAAWAAQFASGTALSARIDVAHALAWAVPRNALQSDERGSYVFQLERGKAHRVDVTVVAPDGSPVGVTGAIDAHAPVITTGSHELADGDAVRDAQPAAPRAPGARAQ